MKKIMMLFAVSMLLLGATGQAMAYFTAGDLIEVVYQIGGMGNEVLTDLGSASTWTTSSAVPTASVTTNISAANLSTLFPGASYSSLDAAFFTFTPATGASGNFWVSGPLSGQSNTGFQKSSTKGAMNSVLSLASTNSGGTNQAVQASASSANTYYNALDGGGTNPGAFKSFIPAGNGEVSLAALAAGGTATLDLYYYPNATSNTAGTGLSVAEITLADGSTQIAPQPQATPIPATFLLFGSGLLGLVGIRRKQQV